MSTELEKLNELAGELADKLGKRDLNPPFFEIISDGVPESERLSLLVDWYGKFHYAEWSGENKFPKKSDHLDSLSSILETYALITSNLEFFKIYDRMFKSEKIILDTFVCQAIVDGEIEGLEHDLSLPSGKIKIWNDEWNEKIDAIEKNRQNHMEAFFEENPQLALELIKIMEELIEKE